MRETPGQARCGRRHSLCDGNLFAGALRQAGRRFRQRFWWGANFHASIHEIFGMQFSANNVQSLATVSGVEAPPSVQLFNLWIERKSAATRMLASASSPLRRNFWRAGMPICLSTRRSGGHS
jgi:hypothetical protein